MARLLSIFLCTILFTSPSFAKDFKKDEHKDEHYNQRYKHLVPPQAHLRVDSKPCQSPCLVTLDASKSRAHKNATIVKYVFDFGDGSPLFESSNPIVTYNYVYIKESLSKKHKHKKNIKEFHPKVFVIDSNNKKSKSDREKVRIIAQVDTTPVNQAPVASLSVSPNSGVAPLSVTLDASGSSDDKGITLYTFEFGDGETISATTPSITHAYASGNFSAKVSVFDVEGLSSSATASITVTIPNSAPSADLSASPLSGDAPLTVTFDSSLSTDDKAVVSRVYNFGDGQSLTSSEAIVTHVYQSAGGYSASVVVSDLEGLTSTSATVAITAKVPNQAPIANLSATPLSGVAPLTVTFDSSLSTDDKAVVSRVYNFGDGQSLTTTEAVVSHLYQQSGNFTASVEIFDQENLSSTKSVAIEVNTPNTAPIASLSVDKVRANPGASFKFDGSASTDAENNIISYSLSNSVLGINQTNTTGIFDVVINQSGSFDFILEVTDSMNLKSSASVNVSVNAPPIALLSADKISGVAPLTVTFDSSASSDDVSIVKRDYQFAPNVFALNAGSSVSYTYNEAGVYPVKIKIYDGENLVSEATVEITVTAPEIKTPPIAWFQVEIDPNTYKVTLKNMAQKGSSEITSIHYELVGTELTAESGLFPYSEFSFDGEFGATYQIKQVVQDQQNQVAEQIFNITLDPAIQKPIANFKIAQSNIREVFLGAVRTFDPFDQITSIKVNWGDNTPVEILSDLFAKHSYAVSGSYSITLRVENAAGQFATRTRQITVTDEAVEPLMPVANFIAEYDDRAKHVRLFSQYSGTANGSILSFFWEYGDGQVGYGEQSVHFYTPGIFYARLTITDSMNLRASQVQQIIITEDGPPIISGLDCDSFSSFANCEFFTAHKDKQLDRVEIDWQDGSPIESFPVINNEWQIFSEVGHSYQNDGAYTISIRAVTFTGLESTSTAQVLISSNGGGNENVPPIPSLNCFTIEYTLVQCDATGSFDSDGFIQSYEISMGDGTIYNTDLVNHTFQNSGSFPVTLKIIDNLGAESTTQTTVNVLQRQNEAPLANLNCYSSGLNQLSCDSSFSTDIDGFITSAEYKFDDGSSIIKNSNVETVVKDFETGGQKFVEVIVTDNEGAQGSASGTFFVINDNPPSGDFYCNSNETLKLDCGLSFADDDAGAPSVQFEFIQGQVTSLPSSYTYASNGDKTVRMILTDSRNQQTIIEKTFSIIPNQAPIAKITSDKLAVVAPGIIHLSSTESSDPENHAITKLWTLPDGSNRADDEFDLNIDVIGKVSVTLVVTDSYGFSNSATLNLAGKSDFANTIILSKSSTQVPSTFTMSPTLLEDEFGDPLTFEWWINGQRKSTNANYSEAILDPGVFEIKLVSIDLYGDRYETILIETLETHPLYFALNRYEGYAAQGEAVEFQIGNLVTDSPDYQINITSTDPNAIFELVNNNAFTIQSSILGSPIEITVTATDGIDSFERKANVQFAEMQFFNLSLSPDASTTLSFEGKTLMDISATATSDIGVGISRINQNEFLLKISQGTAIDGARIDLSNLNTEFEYGLLNANGSEFGEGLSNSAIDFFFSPNLIGGFFLDLIPRLDHYIRLRPKDLSSDRYITKDIGSTSVSFFEVNQRLFLDSAGNLKFNEEENLRSLKKAIDLGANIFNTPIILLTGYEFKKILQEERAAGYVVRGVDRIFINIDKLNYSVNDPTTFWILRHESHHLLQYGRLNYYLHLAETFDFVSQKNIVESSAEKASLDAILGLNVSAYQNIKNLTLVRTQLFNEDLKNQFITDGFIVSKESYYKNELYLNFLSNNGIDEFKLAKDAYDSGRKNVDLLTEFKLLNASSQIASFLNTMSSDSDSDIGYGKIGFSLPAAALDPVTDRGSQPVGPYGFGYLQVPVTEINAGIMTGNIFRIEIEQDAETRFEYLNIPYAQNQSSFSSFSKKYSKGNKSVYEASVKVGTDNLSAIDGFIALIHDSSSSSSFTVTRTQGICDPNNEFEFYGSTSRSCYQCDTSNPILHHYPAVDQCLLCDESLGYKIYDPAIDELKKCIYCPIGSLRFDGTCDLPAPIIDSEPGEVIAAPSGDCPRYRDGINIVYTSCSYTVTCQGGILSPTSSNNIYWASGKKYECIPYDDGSTIDGHPRGSWKADSTYDPGSLIVSCSNSDVINDTRSITLTCDQ